MGTADLKLGTIVLPRSESPQAISRLTEFEWFHKIDSASDQVTPEIDDLLLEAQKIFQSIDDVVKGMGIPLTVGIMEILFKGTVIKKKNYEIDEIEHMINDLRKTTPSIIDNPAKLLDDAQNTRLAIEEYKSLKDTLEVIRKMQIEGRLESMKVKLEYEVVLNTVREKAFLEFPMTFDFIRDVFNICNCFIL